MFEVGDLVKCTLKARKGYDGKVGKIYEVDGVGGGLSFRGYPYGGNEPSRFEFYKKKGEVMQYEDKWHLNDGSVEIPDSAEKLMNPEGTSVVAFRKPVEEVVCTRWVFESRGDVSSFCTKKFAESTGRHVTGVKYTFRGDKLVKVQIVE
jgi:hypothetical protein